MQYSAKTIYICTHTYTLSPHLDNLGKKFAATNPLHRTKYPNQLATVSWSTCTQRMRAHVRARLWHICARIAHVRPCLCDTSWKNSVTVAHHMCLISMCKCVYGNSHTDNQHVFANARVHKHTHTHSCVYIKRISPTQEMPCTTQCEWHAPKDAFLDRLLLLLLLSLSLSV